MSSETVTADEWLTPSMRGVIDETFPKLVEAVPAGWTAEVVLMRPDGLHIKVNVKGEQP